VQTEDPICIFVRHRKTIRSFLDFLSWRQFHLQYLPMKKKTSQGNHFFSRYGGSKLKEEISQRPCRRWTPVYIPVCQRKLGRAFCNCFLQCNLDLNTHSKKILKMKHNCIKYRCSKTSQNVSNVYSKRPRLSLHPRLSMWQSYFFSQLTLFIRLWIVAKLCSSRTLMSKSCS
jgi:hypothetical protein